MKAISRLDADLAFSSGALGPVRIRLARCVPRVDSKEAMSSVVSSEVEHQTRNLAVAGSTPVPPTAGCKPAHQWPEGGGRLTDPLLPAHKPVRPARVRIHLRMAEDRTGHRQHVSGWGSTNECHEVRGYRFQPPSASGRKGTTTRRRYRLPPSRDPNDRRAEGD